MDKDKITNVGWFKAGKTLPVDGFLIAQVTLKTASSGTWEFDLNPEDVQGVISGKMVGTITQGVMNITTITYNLNGGAEIQG
jgi:hypothetical protein